MVYLIYSNPIMGSKFTHPYDCLFIFFTQNLIVSAEMFCKF